jgi:hypothetical protein
MRAAVWVGTAAGCVLGFMVCWLVLQPPIYPNAKSLETTATFYNPGSALRGETSKASTNTSYGGRGGVPRPGSNGFQAYLDTCVQSWFRAPSKHTHRTKGQLLAQASLTVSSITPLTPPTPPPTHTRTHHTHAHIHMRAHAPHTHTRAQNQRPAISPSIAYRQAAAKGDGSLPPGDYSHRPARCGTPSNNRLQRARFNSGKHTVVLDGVGSHAC